MQAGTGLERDASVSGLFTPCDSECWSDCNKRAKFLAGIRLAYQFGAHLKGAKHAMKTFLLCATAATALAAASAANATVILTFGQSGALNTITATNGLSSTHIAATAVPVTLSPIDAVPGTPLSPFFPLSPPNTRTAPP